jgi:hypothetical protein
VRNNIFAFGQDFQWMRTRAEEHVSFTMEHNIVYYDSGRLLGGNWSGDGFHIDHNLYWDERGETVRLAPGQDAHSVVADPRFVNAGSYDFRLRPDSPALKLGFQPIDLEGAGPRGPAGLPAPSGGAAAPR